MITNFEQSFQLYHQGHSPFAVSVKGGLRHNHVYRATTYVGVQEEIGKTGLASLHEVPITFSLLPEAVEFRGSREIHSSVESPPNHHIKKNINLTS